MIMIINGKNMIYQMPVCNIKQHGTWPGKIHSKNDLLMPFTLFK